jgi:hypothetical protein
MPSLHAMLDPALQCCHRDILAVETRICTGLLPCLIDILFVVSENSHRSGRTSSGRCNGCGASNLSLFRASTIQIALFKSVNRQRFARVFATKNLPAMPRGGARGRGNSSTSKSGACFLSQYIYDRSRRQYTTVRFEFAKTTGQYAMLLAFSSNFCRAC